MESAWHGCPVSASRPSGDQRKSGLLSSSFLCLPSKATLVHFRGRWKRTQSPSSSPEAHFLSIRGQQRGRGKSIYSAMPPPEPVLWVWIYRQETRHSICLDDPFLHLWAWHIYESESEVVQSCPTLCDSTDCSLPVSSVHGIFQARVLEWGAISFFRGSFQPRDQTWVHVYLYIF